MCAVKVKKDVLYCWNCKSDQSKCRPLETAGQWQAEKITASKTLQASTHFGRPVEKVKSFEEFVKGKKSRSEGASCYGKPVKKKPKVEDVTINIGLKKMVESNLKTTWGKRLPITVSRNAAHCQILERAVEKWAAFDRSIDSQQEYVLLYEDGSSALFMPGDKKEFFELQKYKDALGKDFKRITLYLCLTQDHYEAEGIPHAEQPDDLEIINADLLPSSLGDLTHFDVPVNFMQNAAASPAETDSLVLADEIYARNIQEQLDSLPLEEDLNKQITSVGDVLKILQERVDKSKQFFLTTRRGVQLSRLLQLWQRQEKKSHVTGTLVVKYVGEDGIDQGALSREFLADAISDLSKHFFPGGSPINSTLHVQNGNFETCGKIAAVSLSQGGPLPCFLEKCVYDCMFRDYNMQEIKDEDLTMAERNIVEEVRKDPEAHTEIILDSSYTGIINQDNIGDISNSLKVSFINRRCLYMKEFTKGLDSYNILQLIKDYPSVCEKMFVSKYAKDTNPDADYLYSLFQPQFAEKDSSRRTVEETMMDDFQDLLHRVEDGMIVPKTSVTAWNHPTDVTDKPEECIQQSEVSIASILGWFTGQRHRAHGPWQDLSIKVIFDHECKIRNQVHTVCYPVIHACSREVTLPVQHMSSAVEFEQIFMTGFTHGYYFARH